VVRRVDKRQQSLFDDTPSVEERLAAAPEDWEEVTQARFLSWPDDQQRLYCARRDESSALTAEERGEDPLWYLERAKGYR
jgi:hypothetical protein